MLWGMADPYATLGVKRGDSEEAIRRAYRKLAKRHHPDLNPDDSGAADRFKEINAANDLLSDPERRARFDRGEIDAEGNQRAPQGHSWRDYAGAGAGAEAYGGRGFAAEDLSDLFGHAFGEAAGGGREGGRGGRGRDAHYTLSVGFLEAVRGGVRRVALPDGRTLDVTLPPGVRDGHVLRLRGQGRSGRGAGAVAGDALVEISVAPHAHFRREGDDILLDLPVTLKETVLGATIEVPTAKGRVRLTIPPGSGTGTRLRLKGRGVGDGHQYVVLRPVLPQGVEPALAAFLRDWTPEHAPDPRAGLEDE